MRAFGAALRLVLTLWRRRLLPRWVLAVALVAALAPACTAPGGAAGYALLGRSSELLAGLLAVLGAMLGAVAVSQDAQSGALRAVLLRPIRRSTYVGAHACVLALAVLLLYGLGILLAASAIGLRHGYGEARLGELVLVTGDELAQHARRLVAWPALALVAASAIGLLASVVVDDVAVALALALVAGAGPVLYQLAMGDLPRGVFAEAPLLGPPLLRELANGDTHREGLLRSGSVALRILLAPLLTTLGAVAVAALVAEAREART
jgi:hypothetical protein